MNLETHNTLNDIYGHVYQRAKEIYLEIFAAGHNAMFEWHNMHSKKYHGEMLTQFYPIPVISIDSVGEIGVDIDSVFFELRVDIDKALTIDYKVLGSKYDIEIFGQKNYLKDLYHKNMTSEEIIKNITEAEEKNIKIYATFPEDVKALELMGLWEMVGVGE